MKIYTEVIMQWDDDKGKLVDISSESYEYSGDVALCGGNTRQHSWEKSDRANPYHWTMHQTGNRVPRELKMGSMLPLNLVGKNIPGIHSSYRNIPISGGGNENDYNVYKYGNTAGEPRWKEGWYDPYFRSRVNAPIRQIIGVPQGRTSIPSLENPYGQSAGTIIDPSKSEFQPWNEVMSEANLDPQLWGGVQGVGQYASEAGYQNPLVAKGLVPELRGAGQDMAAAQTMYDADLQDFEDERTSARIDKKDKLRDIRINRMSKLLGKEEIEEATAVQGTGGFAYSAPAARKEKEVKEESIKTMSDFKREEYDARDEFTSEMDRIQEAQYDRERDFIDDKRTSIDDLGNIMLSNVEGAQALSNMGSDIFASHKTYGAGISGGGRGAYYGHDRYGGGYGGGPTWGETDSDEALLLARVAEESGTFGEALQSQAASISDQLLADLATVGTEEGGV